MPRDGRATRERILDAAQRLVVDQGFSATSVEQVIAASSTSKGSFFHHFASKQALAQALVERDAAADLALLDEALAAAARGGADPVQQAVAFVRFLEGRFAAATGPDAAPGCLSAAVLAEHGLLEAGTRTPIQQAAAAWRERYAALLRAALDDRGIAGIPVEPLADHVVVTIRGATLLARATGDPDVARQQLRALRLLLWAMLR